MGSWILISTVDAFGTKAVSLTAETEEEAMQEAVDLYSHLVEPVANWDHIQDMLLTTEWFKVVELTYATDLIACE